MYKNKKIKFHRTKLLKKNSFTEVLCNSESIDICVRINICFYDLNRLYFHIHFDINANFYTDFPIFKINIDNNF